MIYFHHLVWKKNDETDLTLHWSISLGITSNFGSCNIDVCYSSSPSFEMSCLECAKSPEFWKPKVVSDYFAALTKTAVSKDHIGNHFPTTLQGVAVLHSCGIILQTHWRFTRWILIAMNYHPILGVSNPWRYPP